MTATSAPNRVAETVRTGAGVGLRVIPLTVTEARRFVGEEHRHHPKVTGGRFAIGALRGDQLVGVAIIGNVGARQLRAPLRAEVTRLATDGSPNVCSFLYGRARRVWQAMGGTSLKTYTHVSEPGTSLRAAGVLAPEHTTRAEQWDRPSRPRRRAAMVERKYRWELIAGGERGAA